MTSFLRKIWRSAGDAVFPRFCVACKKEGSLLCEPCANQWQPESRLALDPSDVICEHVWSSAYADPITRELICSWKYYFDASAWEILKKKLGSNFTRVSDLIARERIDAVVPIPLHDERLCERGFDQAETLARFVAKQTKLPCRQLLIRTRKTGKQAERTEDERKSEMKDTPFETLQFEIPKRIILIDDVWTTGSTASAAARVLKAGGAEKIFMYTIAKG